ncbi:aspartate aminotransferase family protein [Mycolicibacterium bacteremicum]|uniref:Aspartate aminotransferase family protein n=1 Tax=Mycolicibacterium bacteremicum TaxID=564198 RepID=A0A1W9YTW5_MYCBA|nr:aspartate aminotransferase family protein [Mycolicibacterium bacteremicum]MCV7432207.1 aspartate aminotransferase family protein [Mycolicibacterium bacteremicum]ORA03511.1 aspartate aminotransferase family protein [Mycolicibacterium bacteremicum]
MPFSNIMDSNSYQGGRLDDPLIAARGRVLGPAYRLFYDEPVHLVRGQGTRLYDADGQVYLDAYNNVASVGHCHPHVIDAVTRQLSTLNTHTRYLHEGIVEYSQRLLATFPEPQQAGAYQIMYACTGSEVNDLALRVAGMYTGARGVIVTTEAYHGNTEAVTAISPSLGGAATLGPHVRTVEPDLKGLPAAIADLQASGHGVSALIVDTIFSSDGIYPDPTVLAPAAELVRAAGGVLIADEVQPGFGRTGAGMWGFSRHGVVPELVTTGKPMANGMPVAAMAARSEVLAPFAETVPYFNTFGGNPVSMAAASAVLDIIEDEKLIANAASVGAALRSAVCNLADPRIGAVRGVGLYLGVELPDREFARRVVNGMRARRVLISVCGAGGNVLKIRPPMVFSLSDVDWFIAEFAEVLASLAE